MKAAHFYVLLPLLAAAQSGLALAGILAPLSSYSAGQVIFGLAKVFSMVWMGWSLSGLGLKKVAGKGALASLIAVMVVSSFSLVGNAMKRPVLGIPIPSVYFLPFILALFCIENIIILAFFAVIGAWVAKRIKKPGRR